MKQSLAAAIAIAVLGVIVMIGGAVFAIAMFAGDADTQPISIGGDVVLWIAGISLYVLAIVRARTLLGTDAVHSGGPPPEAAAQQLLAWKPRLAVGLRVFGSIMIALNTGLLVLVILGQGDATAYVQVPFGYAVGFGTVVAGRRLRRPAATELHGSAS